MISIENDGPEIVATNYFDTEHARRGLLYLSTNAGCFRLLLPNAMADQLAEMSTGHSAEIERTGDGLRVWFLDGTSNTSWLTVHGQPSSRPTRETGSADSDNGTTFTRGEGDGLRSSWVGQSSLCGTA